MNKSIVYLEKNKLTDEFITSCVYDAWVGFTNLGYDCQPFNFDQLNFLDISKETIVVGYIRAVKKALEILKCDIPIEVSYPDELLKFLGRKIWTSTLGEIRENEPKCFIKPLKEQKLFTGHVRSDNMGYLTQTSYLPDYTEVLCSEPINFITEWRGFVLKGELVGLKNYKGDETKIPDSTVINEAIKKYKSSPVAYSIDMGLDDQGRTLLVEVNDAYALGSYGLDPVKYAQMIEARWNEIVYKENI